MKVNMKKNNKKEEEEKDSLPRRLFGKYYAWEDASFKERHGGNRKGLQSIPVWQCGVMPRVSTGALTMRGWNEVLARRPSTLEPTRATGFSPGVSSLWGNEGQPEEQKQEEERER